MMVVMRFVFSLLLDRMVLFVFIGLLEIKIVGMFKCIVVISMSGVILL